MQKSASGTLLIVDDEPGVRRSLARLMRKEGYEIHSAESAIEAADILAQSSVDIILCDQDMPGQSGTEFLRDIAPKYPHQRRIMLSGRFRSDDVAAALDSGAVHKFMMKPWDDTILKADIRESFRQLMLSVTNEERLGDANDASATDNPLSPAVPDVTWGSFNANRELSRELHSAASSGALQLQYQPQVDAQSLCTSGFEALLRWQSSNGPVRPDHFISLAERNGSISKLTRWVINETCYRLSEWQQVWPDIRVGLNVSPIDLRADYLVEFVAEAIKNNPLERSALQIEVTESQALTTDEKTVATLEALSSLGVTLAIDDFGAGATSLSTLASLPFNTLKLDRSLTTQVETQKGEKVIRKILEMCDDLSLKTTVEGVESLEQLQLFQELGATTIQGYYFSPPIDLSDVDSWMKSGATGVAGG